MKKSIIVLILILASRYAAGQYYGADQSQWIRTAQALTPKLFTQDRKPVQCVRLAEDKASFQGWLAKREMDTTEACAKYLQQGDELTFDFGDLVVGHVRFSINTNRSMDAPARIVITFGETPAEIGRNFSSYNGTLSRSWLQEETVTIDAVPAKINLPRRYSFRYMKIRVEAVSSWYKLRISSIHAEETSSAPFLEEKISGNQEEQIVNTAKKTLQKCMQTVFEDGPKRDRRLWIGDLRLEALANYSSFKNYNLVKRCLYLLAGLSREDGLVPATVFERPFPHAQEHVCLDYALLFNVALSEYVDASGDVETGQDLWQVALRQIEYCKPLFDAKMLIQVPKEKDWWVFIDWNDKLDKEVALQGVYIFALEKTLQLAKRISKENEIKWAASTLPMIKANAYRRYYDKTKKCFITSSKQKSASSQAWMVLSNVITGNEAIELMRRTIADTTMLKARSPYGQHYIAEALLHLHMKTELSQFVEHYWGTMLDRGADTFWEVFDEKDEMLSPYKDSIINSYCHAWSCTPIYLLTSINNPAKTK